jgi:hypothetical protein
LGYKHKIQKSTVKDEDEEVLPNVHRVASLLKRWLLGTHQSYLNKISWGIIWANMYSGTTEELQIVEACYLCAYLNRL